MSLTTTQSIEKSPYGDEGSGVAEMTATPEGARPLTIVPPSRSGNDPMVPKTGAGCPSPAISMTIQLGAWKGGIAILPR